MSNTLRFTFKLVYTTNVWQTDVDISMSTAEFITRINQDRHLRQLSNIHQQYHIELVKTGNAMYKQSELAPSIVGSFSETIGENFTQQTASIYIRPVHPITLEFTRRDDYSDAITI